MSRTSKYRASAMFSVYGDNMGLYRWLQSRINVQHGFLANVLVLSGGTSIAQALSILVAPWLSRIYSPADYGIFAAYGSLLSILLTVASLRYEIAIPLPKDDESARQLAALSLAISGAISAGSLLIVLVCGHLVEVWTNVHGLAAVMLLLPLNLLLGGVFQVQSYWVTRTKQFMALSSIRALQSVSQAAVQIGLGLAHFQPWGLIIGPIGAQVIGLVGLRRATGDVFRLRKNHRWVSLMREYRHFPLYTTWASLVDTLGLQAPALLFTTLFDISTTGLFSLSTRMLALPAQLIGQAVGDVFYPTAASIREDAAKSQAMLTQLATQLLFAGFLVFTPVMIYGPLLFSVVFGVRWERAGMFAAYLSPWLIVSFVTSPLSPLSLVHQKLRENFAFSLVVTVVRLLAIWVGSLYHSVELAVMLFSVAGCAIYVIYGWWLFRLAGSSLLVWLGQIRFLVISWALLVTALFLAKAILPPPGSVILSIAGLMLFAAYHVRWVIRLGSLKPTKSVAA